MNPATLNGRANVPVRRPAVRKLFCKREAEFNGITWRYELRADGLHVRRKHSRKVRVLTFSDALVVLTGQKLLNLQ